MLRMLRIRLQREKKKHHPKSQDAENKAKKRETETDEEAAKRKQQRAIQRERKIPKSHYDARNAQKVLLGEQIYQNCYPQKTALEK